MTEFKDADINLSFIEIAQNRLNQMHLNGQGLTHHYLIPFLEEYEITPNAIPSITAFLFEGFIIEKETEQRKGETEIILIQEG